MVSLFRTASSPDEIVPQPATPLPDASAAEPEEFEIVLGRTQLASVLFVATVVIAVLSSLSYVAGKSLAPPPKKVEIIRTVSVPAPAVVTPSVQASAVKPEPDVKPESPILGEPHEGPLYLQMGAVEKGIAIIFAEGLRKHGLEAFVAPGPNENIFRVLIGPLADEQAYQKAKQTVAAIGLTTFARRYQP
jgi:cell division septation protein DedD